MKRLLCATLLATAALAVPAAASEQPPVQPIVWTQPNRVGVGANYSLNGGPYDPLGGAWVNPQTGQVCFGLSYQIPFCT